MNLLFVCMGNICRSPVVEAVVRSEFARAGLAVEVASAATESYHIGGQADSRSIASARRMATICPRIARVRLPMRISLRSMRYWPWTARICAR